MKYELRRLPPVRTANVGAVVYAILFAIIAVVLLLPMTYFAPGVDAQGNSLPKQFGLGLVIAYPFLGAIIGWVGGVVTSAIYNMVAGWMGGLHFEAAPVGPDARAQYVT